MVCLSYVGFFYFTLGNLEPKYRSKLTSIQLLGIVKKSVLDSYGMNAILKPFVEDFKKLVGNTVRSCCTVVILLILFLRKEVTNLTLMEKSN